MIRESANRSYTDVAVPPPPKAAGLDAITRYMDAERSAAEGERVHALRALGVSPHACTRRVASLLLGHAPLDAGDVQVVVADLSGLGLDNSIICQALLLIGVTLGLDECERLVERAEVERERVQRPGENFTVIRVARRDDGYGVYFACTLASDAGTVYRVSLRPIDLSGERRFVARCLSSVGFVPLLKEHYRGPGFVRFAASLIDAAVIVA